MRHSFTKRLVAAIVMPYFIVVGIGIYVVLKIDVSQFSALCAFVGTPVATAVGFYCWKAKAENIRKIACGMTAEQLEKVRDTAGAVGSI